jgi:hypothetical protein
LAGGIRTAALRRATNLKAKLFGAEDDFIEQQKRKIKVSGSKREQPAVRRFEAQELTKVSRAWLDIFWEARTLPADGRGTETKAR